MDDTSANPSLRGALEEDETSGSKVITKESIISQINKIYNTYFFRVIRQYCRGFKPNILLQNLIRLVSSLQEELKYYSTDTLGEEDYLPHFTPIVDFISYINFDSKVQNIKLFCSRMEQGISNFTTISTLNKKSDNFLEINSCYIKLSNACTELNSNSLTIENICIAIHAYEKLREVVNKVILESLSSTISPARSKRIKKKKSEDSINVEIKVSSAEEVLNL